MNQKTEKKTKGKQATSKRSLFKFKDWRIRRADPSNLVIEQYREKNDKNNPGTMDWFFVGYHGTLEGACMMLSNEIGMQSDTLEEAISAIRELRTMLESTLKGRK